MQTSSLLSRLLKPGATRRSVIMLWCISSSLFLFYFSLASSISKKDLVIGYFTFAFLLFGSGASYHVLVELLKIEQDKKNKWCWRAMLKHLLILQTGYIGAGITIYTGITLGGMVGSALAVFSMLLGYFWVFFQLISSMKKIENLFGIRWFSSDQQQRLENTPSMSTYHVSKKCRNHCDALRRNEQAR